MSDFFLLSERQIARISPHFPLSHSVAHVDDQRVVSGIVDVVVWQMGWLPTSPNGIAMYQAILGNSR
ncbi:hypothetical protein AB4Z52_26270 [Rhizobium sp. 2YAF20]|uniref:hypothetical protein n=1 Tax=Rhizobium sp. 2YAF20 TaxID=3233027 RepID=UPI003F996690